MAKLGKLTPESAPPEQQMWHTYPPVQMPSVEGVLAALTRPETWPDYASELGRFTPLRAGGLDGQTFEIEVTAGTESGLPIFTRGYVTITRLATPEDPPALHAYFQELESGLARYGEGEPRAVPEGGEPVVGFDLTTHESHFMGAAPDPELPEISHAGLHQRGVTHKDTDERTAVPHHCHAAGTTLSPTDSSVPTANG